MYSIRATLIFTFSAAALAGILVLGIIIHDQTKKILVANAIRDAEKTATAQSYRIAEWIEGNEKELALLTEIDTVQNFEPEPLRLLLIHRASSRKDLSGLFYATPQGQAWGTLAPEKQLDVSGTQFFRTMITEQKTHRLITYAATDPTDGNAKVFLIRSVYNKKAEIVGLLGAGLRLDRLSEVVNTGNHKDSYGWVIDRDGLILAHPNAKFRMKLNIMKSAQFGMTGLEAIGKRMLAQESGQGEAFGPDGAKRYIVYTPVPDDSGWSYAISIPAKTITDQVNEMLRNIAPALGLTLLIPIALVWLLARRISKPIEQLARHARRLADGHLSEQLQFPAGTGRELHNLAGDINQMAAGLNETMGNLLKSEHTTTMANIELARHRDALISSEARHQLAMEASNDILWDVDLQQNSVMISSRWEALSGAPPQTPKQLLAVLRSLVYPADWPELKRKLHIHLHGRSGIFQHEFRLKLKDGEIRWRGCRGKALQDEKGRIIHLCGSLADIHEQKENEQKIKHMAFHDSLTGLPNRWLFLERLDQAISRPAGDWQGALLFMNLNRFKMLNDLYGHQEGDELLREVAKRMDSLRQNDATFARLGGDEFVLLLPDVPSPEAMQEVADAMLRFIRAPISTRQREYRLTASIGISLFPHDGTDPSELMRKADIALQAAKDLGRNGWHLFDPGMLEQIRHKNETEQALRQAMRENEFSLNYQPQFSLQDNTICGFEALIRWTRAGVGPVSPVEFIPLAEEIGLIIEIGDWVLKTACTQLAVWHEAGFTDIRMAINVSAIQLKQGFADRVARVLVQTGLPARALEIEITESVLMQSFTDHMIELESLRELGIHIALDDFGTGYSSLSYLRQLPIHTVKIDKSFVDDLTNNSTTRHITESIISLSHALGLEIVAEGIESKAQLDFLRQAGCEMGQGYFIARPLQAHAATELLLNGIQMATPK